MQQSEFDGQWREAEHVTLGDLAWLDPSKSGTPRLSGKPVGTIRTQLFKRGFTVNVPSWIWSKPLNGSAAQAFGIGETEVKGFPVCGQQSRR